MQSAEVRLQDLTKLYHALPAVDRISLTIAPGSMLALLGPSGCGKTTCLRMIAGLVQPTSGDIVVNGKPITAVPVHRRNVGMLFQNYALFPHMSVAENVAFGLQMRGVGQAELKRRVAEALDLVQLTAMEGRMPGQLSGGQQQRVGLARALVIEPAMLLLDEPLGALDKSLREDMQVELRSLQRRLGLTTIMVTHDQDEALTMADQVVVMRAGRLEQAGAPVDIYARPVNRFVAGFIGASNFFNGTAETRDGVTRVTTPGGIVLQLPGLHADAVVTVTVRPEAIMLGRSEQRTASAPNTAIATVEHIVYRGGVSHYHLRAEGGESLIAYTQNLDGEGGGFTMNDRVFVRWASSAAHVLRDEDTDARPSV